MPYMGVKVSLTSYDLSVKLHGPLDVIGVNTVELREKIKALIRSYDTTNFPVICRRLADDLRDKYCDGHVVVWAQVDVIAKNDVTYGASAERISASNV